jgi:hypothetical protein
MTSLENGNIDIDCLRAFYRDSDKAAALLDRLARRKRHWHETKVERLDGTLTKDGMPLSRGDVVEVLKKLDELGCGTFIVGRRGWSSRMAWDVDVASLGRAAAGEDVALEQTSGDAFDDQDADGDHEMRKHAFMLREDLDLSLNLPLDLTERESKRLAQFIKALPLCD